VAESVALLNGYRYAGVCDPTKRSPAGLFFVPDDTLMLDEPRALGIHSPHQLYGAVVPYPFVKTKAITHGLVSARAARLSGWSSAFTRSVRDAVLPGHTAFDFDDARQSATRLLQFGPVRLKDPLGDGGRGQTVVTEIAELDAFLEKFPFEKMASHGLVLETNLRRVTTRSVGLRECPGRC